MQINAINSIPSVPGSRLNQTAKSGTSFADVMSNALDEVNNLQIESSKMTDSFISGETDNIHSVVMEAYKEVMNMQI